MQKIEGDGLAFVHAGGSIAERVLRPGEVIRVDTGCLVAMTQDVDYDIEMVKGVKTALFGGEGLFFATLRGQGVCGFNLCRSAGWQIAWHRHQEQAAGKKREAS